MTSAQAMHLFALQESEMVKDKLASRELEILTLHAHLKITEKELEDITKAADPDNTSHEIFWRIAHEALQSIKPTK